MQDLESGKASINSKEIINFPGVKLDHRSLEIFLNGRERIRLYVFNTLMLPIEEKREGNENYSFSGPRLGLYHDTADPREGPYINHYVERLEIQISYPYREEAQFTVGGSCDLVKSSFDPSLYEGGTSGKWEFEVFFTHKFRRA